MASTQTNRALTQYSGDTPSSLFIRDVDGWRFKLKRTDTPLQRMIGDMPPKELAMLKDEWGWGSPRPDQDSITSTINSSITTIPVTNGANYMVGQEFWIETETFLVDSVNGNNVTVVTRPYGGSAASHTSGMTVFLGSTAMRENQATPLAPIAQGEVDFNYYQQIEESIQISHRANVIPTYESRGNGGGDRDMAEIQKKLKYEIPPMFENVLLKGVRNLGSTTSASSMGGIFTSGYNTTSNTSLSGPLTENTLLTNLQTAWMLVGGDMVGTTVMGPPILKRIVNSWYNDTRRTTSTDSKINVTFDTIHTDFGDLKFVINYKMVDSSTTGAIQWSRLMIANFDDFKLRPLSADSRWAIYKTLPIDGWYTRLAVRGDYTLRAENPDSRVVLGGFSVTESDYPSLS